MSSRFNLKRRNFKALSFLKRPYQEEEEQQEEQDE